MRRPIRYVFLFLVLALALSAACSSRAQEITGDLFTLRARPVPSPPGSIAWNQYGTTGTTASRYYWVSAVYPQGESSFSGPAQPLTGPAALNAANYFRLTWPAATGAISYNVVRTGSSAYPASGNILLINTTTTVAFDTGGALTAYVLPFSNPPYSYKLSVSPSGMPNLMQFSGLVVNVEDYGASPTNPDSSAAIQAAINACPPFSSDGSFAQEIAALAGGCLVYIPPGEWLAAKILLPSGVWLRGAGQNRTVLKAPNGVNASVIILGLNAAENSMPASPVMWNEISHLTIDGNAANETAGVGIHIGRAGRLYLHDFQLRNTYSDCILADNGAGGAGALGVARFSNFSAYGCGRHGLYLWGAQDFKITGLFFDGLGTANTQGVYLRDVGHFEVQDSWISWSGQHGIYVQHGSPGLISGNSIYDIGEGGAGQGILLGDGSVGGYSAQITVAANQIFRAVSQGIGLFGCEGCVISGNTVDESGLATGNVDAINVSNNAFVTGISILGNRLTPKGTGLAVDDPGNWAGLVVDSSLIAFPPTTFANLGTPRNGTLGYCSNCTVANPCAAGGTGALAKRLNGAWVCN